MNLDIDGKGEVTDSTMRSLIFCDFEDPKAEVKAYRQVQDPKLLTVQKVAEEFLDECVERAPFFTCPSSIG